MTEKNWIVVLGSLINTTNGGGLEFFGPFTEPEAQTLLAAYRTEPEDQFPIRLAIQLLKHRLPY